MQFNPEDPGGTDSCALAASLRGKLFFHMPVPDVFLWHPCSYNVARQHSRSLRRWALSGGPVKRGKRRGAGPGEEDCIRPVAAFFATSQTQGCA